MPKSSSPAPFANTTRWSRRIQSTRPARNSNWLRRISAPGKRTKPRKACWQRSKQLPVIGPRKNCFCNCKNHRQRPTNKEGPRMASVYEFDKDAVELQQRIDRFHEVREGIMNQVRQV